MEPKIYITQKKYVTASGEIKYYPNSVKYTPKDKTNRPKQVRKKKEGSIYDITTNIRELDKNDIERVREFVRDLKNAGNKPVRGDEHVNIQGTQDNQVGGP